VMVCKATVSKTGDKDFVFLQSPAIVGDILLHKEVYPDDWSKLAVGKSLYVLTNKSSKGHRVGKVLSYLEFLRAKVARK
jgi:hypothetical protein